MFKRRFMNPYFEADGKGGEGPVDPIDTEPKDDNKPSFDDILKDKAFQAEFDRRLSKGIETALANERKRLEQIADDKISEAEKLAKMSDLEKQKYQQEKEAEELKRREAALTKRELMAEAKVTLADKGLPLELAGLLDYSSADAVNNSITTMAETYHNAVQSGVNEKLKGGKPPREATNNDPSDHDALAKEVLTAMRGN